MTSPRAAVLDTSAVLALFNKEGGSETISALARQSAVSTVILAEVASKMSEWNTPSSEIDRWIGALEIEIVSFDHEQAMEVGALREFTHQRGLSLGDRACLVLARRLKVPAYTSDKAWSDIDIGVAVVQFR